MSENLIIDPKITEIHFACDLEKCKGGCCTVYGDTGAPLLEEEMEHIARNLEAAKEFLSERSLRYLEKHGFWMRDDTGSLATYCIRNQDCVLVYYDGEIAKCALERAYFEGKSDFRKPISCHLFPIRIRDNKIVYEEFSVCSPALNHGINENLLMYEFLKDSIIRRFGKEFYDNLEKFVVGVK
jgi:hypothetical protein